MSTTNYTDTFIAVAEDCPVRAAAFPPPRRPPSAAEITCTMLFGHPYELTSDDVLYAACGEPKGISREAFFSKPQPCLRTSPLTKRYGWGVHADSEGKIAIVAMESEEYKSFSEDKSLRQLRGMRSKRA